MQTTLSVRPIDHHAAGAFLGLTLSCGSDRHGHQFDPVLTNRGLLRSRREIFPAIVPILESFTPKGSRVKKLMRIPIVSGAEEQSSNLPVKASAIIHARLSEKPAFYRD